VTGLDADAICQRMQLDKKAGSQGLKVILLKGLGHAEVVPAPDDRILRSAIQSRIGSDR
jgi:3-dehydroquinate synthetase